MSEEGPKIIHDLQGGDTTAGDSSAFRVVNPITSVPTVYADACVFAAPISGNVRMAFIESILGPSDGPEPGVNIRHVGHLIMPREGFANLVMYLTRVATQMGIEIDVQSE